MRNEKMILVGLCSLSAQISKKEEYIQSVILSAINRTIPKSYHLSPQHSQQILSALSAALSLSATIQLLE
jgi:hypothetical protein